MRLVEKHPSQVEVNPTDERLEALQAYLLQEVEDALSARQAQDAVWRENLRLYEGVPKNPIRNIPVENAPNTEITLGAIACDSIYAQVIDLIFTITPILTCRAIQPKKVPGDTPAKARDAGWKKSQEIAKAMQRFVNWGAQNEWALRPAVEQSALDHVQLGTGCYYIPFVEHKKKTKVNKTTSRAPRILTHPIEDFIIPGGAYDDHQMVRWLGLRWWYTLAELTEKAAGRKWDIASVIPVGAIGWTRTRREQLGRTSTSQQITQLYEIIEFYVYFDIDGDGFDEDLIVAYDRTSQKILRVDWNKYDLRPTEAMRYQQRAHLFYGLGVMDMIRPYQEETSDIHNFRTLNMFLANARFWKAKDGSVPDTMKVWPGKIQFMQDPADLVPEQMADVYPSAPAAEAITIGLAERRVGINDMSTPRPSAVLGSRTPGITAMSMLQQVNRRFTPAFDSIRLATAGAVRQCLFRYQERLLAGDKEVEQHVRRVLGDEDGDMVLEALRDPDFNESIAVELTASSASVNRDADRQNSLLLVNILSQYYEKTLNLVAIAANPQTPPPVRDVARKIAESAGEIIDRTIRTFDQMRDPEAFVIHVEEELDKIQGLSQQGMLGLANIMGNLGPMAAQLGQGGGGQNGDQGGG